MTTVAWRLALALCAAAAAAVAASGLGLRAAVRQPEDRPLPPSPCPEVFSYEGDTVDWDRWYGVVLVATDIPLTGLRLDIWLSRPALALRHNWDGDVTSLDNRRFTILNLYKRVEPGPPESVRVVVKFDDKEDIPLLKAIELNGRQICAAGPGSPSQRQPARPKPTSAYDEDYPERRPPATSTSSKYNFDRTTRRTTAAHAYQDPYDDYKNTVSKKPPSNIADPYEAPYEADDYRPATTRAPVRHEYQEPAKRPAYLDEEPPRRTTERVDAYAKPKPARRPPPDDSEEYRPQGDDSRRPLPPPQPPAPYDDDDRRKTTRRPAAEPDRRREPTQPPRRPAYEEEVPAARPQDGSRRPATSSTSSQTASAGGGGGDTIRVTYVGGDASAPGASSKGKGASAASAGASAARKPTDPPLIDIRINPQPLNHGGGARANADFDEEEADERPPRMPGRGNNKGGGPPGLQGYEPPGHSGSGGPPGHSGGGPPGHSGGGPPGHNKPNHGGSGGWEQPTEDSWLTSSTYRPPTSYRPPTTNRPTTAYRPSSSTHRTTTTASYRPQATTRRPQSTTRRPTTSSHNSGGETHECGKTLSATPLVTYGQNTSRGQWPWHVALYQSKDRDLQYICGGTLVSSNIIVTAAHCVTRLTNGRPVDPDSVLAYLGKYHLQVWTHEEGVQQSKVSAIHVHPSYNISDFRGDVALLELVTPMRYSQYVRPVCLWGPRHVDLEDITNQEGYVVGWGYDEYGQLTDDLRMAAMPVVAQQTCLWSYPEFFSRFTNNMTYCAGFKNGTSVCNGDSGGGMVFPRRHSDGHKQWFLRGLVSTSVSREDRRVCNTKHYVVFTDLAKYQDWIDNYIR